TVCSGTPGFLILNGNTGTPVQWQSAPVAGNFSVIGGSTSTNYINPSMEQTTRYRVIVGTAGCADTSETFTLIVKPSPVAVFSYIISGKQVTFNSTGTSGDVTVYDWDFGDGSTSAVPHPVHVYTVNDTFHVCLTVYNGSNCSYTLCKDVDLVVTGSRDISAEENFIVYPNPFGNSIFIEAPSIALRVM